jgi:hypothetical protein
MNKISHKLLAMTFPTLNTESLMEIICATPNTEVATEILCGLYTEPKLPTKVQELSGDRKILTFVSYNKWDGKVSYSFIREKVITGYFPKGTVETAITLENFNSLKQDWKSGTDQVQFSMKTGESILDSNSCHSESWLKYTNLD